MTNKCPIPALRNFTRLCEGGCVSERGSLFQVAEHSFQEPIPNSPLLLSYLSFGARLLQESRLTTEEFILAFWLRCELFPW